MPAELADLLAIERTAPVSDAVARAAVRARLAATVGPAALGAGGAIGAAIGTAGKLLAVVALVGGGTAATVQYAASRHGVSTAAVAAVAAVAPAPAPALRASAQASGRSIEVAGVEPAVHPPWSAARAQVPPPPIDRIAPTRKAAVRPAPAETPAAGSQPVPAPRSELSLLHDAWLALSAHDAARALALVDADASSNPDGALAEERDALRVATLSALDRRADARAVAAAFLVRYPDSIHRSLVERVLANKDSP